MAVALPSAAQLQCTINTDMGSISRSGNRHPHLQAAAESNPDAAHRQEPDQTDNRTRAGFLAHASEIGLLAIPA
jgi:hypothetical protein